MLMILAVSANPRPVPRVFLVLKNGVKTLLLTSSLIPHPLSRTSIMKKPPSSVKEFLNTTTGLSPES